MCGHVETRVIRALFSMALLLNACGCAVVDSFFLDDCHHADCECGECIADGSSSSGRAVVSSGVVPAGHEENALQPVPEDQSLPDSMTGYPAPHQMPHMNTPPSDYLQTYQHPNMDTRWPPRYSVVPPGMPRNPAFVYEAHLDEVRKQYDEKFKAIEAKLDAQQAVKESLDETLNLLKEEVARLRGELNNSRVEVQRINKAWEAQHRSDMYSLETLVEMVGDLSRVEPRSLPATLPETMNE